MMTLPMMDLRSICCDAASVSPGLMNTAQAARSFTRCIEDFECEHCGHVEIGDGYLDYP